MLIIFYLFNFTYKLRSTKQLQCNNETDIDLNVKHQAQFTHQFDNHNGVVSTVQLAILKVINKKIKWSEKILLIKVPFHNFSNS